jgi:hypothetical protein
MSFQMRRYERLYNEKQPEKSSFFPFVLSTLRDGRSREGGGRRGGTDFVFPKGAKQIKIIAAEEIPAVQRKLEQGHADCPGGFRRWTQEWHENRNTSRSFLTTKPFTILAIKSTLPKISMRF